MYLLSNIFLKVYIMGDAPTTSACAEDNTTAFICKDTDSKYKIILIK